MTIYVLGPVRTEDNLLLRGSEPLAFERRAIALLRALIERSGAMVSKDPQIKAAWPNQAVEESNLTVQIAALRVLGETPVGSRWIETMPRRGYRFAGPVFIAEEKGASEAPALGSAASGPMPTPRHNAKRRQLTAMFCGLVGAAGRADGRDLEDRREAVGAFQRYVSDAVGRRGGFIARFPSARAHIRKIAPRPPAQLIRNFAVMLRSNDHDGHEGSRPDQGGNAFRLWPELGRIF